MDFPYNSALFGLVSYNDLCMQSFEGFSVRQFAVEASFIATKSPSIGKFPTEKKHQGSVPQNARNTSGLVICQDQLV